MPDGGLLPPPAGTAECLQVREGPVSIIDLDLPASEIVDPVASAAAAGLHYVTDDGPGIRRRRSGRGWSYRGPEGHLVRDKDTVQRIKSLSIPPAWMDVWICPHPQGHLQATGRDARGRKQYRYHPRWRAVRDAVKYDRMIAFSEALPGIRARVDHDLARRGLPRERVLATVVRLLENTLIRVGNEEYRRQNKSFGLTTLQNRHVDISGSTVRFHFRGKHGIVHNVTLTDRRLSKIIKQCRDIPGQELFQYVDDEGQRHTIDSADVNGYLQEIAGEDFTAKDFRTWAGTVLATRFFREAEPATTAAESRRRVVRTIEQVAAQLGNTVAVCRKCYVHPAVVEAYLAGSLAALEAVKGEVQALVEGAAEGQAERLARHVAGELGKDSPGGVGEGVDDSPMSREKAGEEGLSHEERAVVDLLRRAAGLGNEASTAV